MPTKLFYKGQTPWNKGISPSKELRERISNTLKKKGIKPTERFVAYGNDNPKWKGDKVGYSGLHYWVYRQLGKPTSCSHCSENRKRFTWANVSGLYKRDTSDWLNLCYSCHKKFDLGRIKQ